MSQLEDLMPEMAGVFAAQEAALDNVLAIVTAQLHALTKDNASCLKRLTHMEEAQRHTQLAVDALASARPETSPPESPRPVTPLPVVPLDPLPPPVVSCTSSVSLEDLAELRATLATQLEATVEILLADRVLVLEAELTAKAEERMRDETQRMTIHLQASDEAMRTQLELLDKKFDYMSRIKMEVKEMGRRVDKQDQTIDDMRTGFALLAKSVGTDEIDHDSDHEDDEDDEDDEVAEKEENPSSGLDDPTRKDSTMAVPMPTPLVTVPPLSITQRDPEPEKEQEDPVVPDSAASHLEDTPRTAEREPEESTKVEEVPGEAEEEKDTEEPSETGEETKGEEEEEPARGGLSPEEEMDASDAGEAVVVVESESEQDEAPPAEQEATPMEEDVITSDPAEEKREEQNPNEAEVPSPEVVEAHEQEQEQEQEPQEEQAAVTTELENQGQDADAGESESKIESNPLNEAALEPVEVVAETIPPPTVSNEKLASSREEDEDDDLHEPMTHRGSLLPSARERRTSSITHNRHRRLTRRQSGHLQPGSARKRPSSTPAPPHVPMTKDKLRSRWREVFVRIVQLRRLQSIHGESSASRPSFFRRANHVSMGARVRRLEDTALDLEETVDQLERNQRETEEETRARAGALDDEVQRIASKVGAWETELRRLRGSIRRESTQNGGGGSVQTAQLSAQLQVLVGELQDQKDRHLEFAASLTRLSEGELPAMVAKAETAVESVRHELETRARELAKELVKVRDKGVAAQRASEDALTQRLTLAIDPLYRDLLVLSSALLQSVELAKRRALASVATTSPTGDSSLGKPRNAGAVSSSPFEVCVDLVTTSIATFQSHTRPLLASAEVASTLALLLDKLAGFTLDLDRLQEQVQKLQAHSNSVSAQTLEAMQTQTQAQSQAQAQAQSPSQAAATTTTAGIEDHLTLLCATQLRTFEGVLSALTHSSSSSSPSVDPGTHDATETLVRQIKDFVIQLRAVLVLLLLHAQLLEPQLRLHSMHHSQLAIKETLASHGATLGQVATLEAVVKLMGGRLDSFVELTFSFAKDADVKTSIQDLLTASDDLRENVNDQVERVLADSSKREELMDREVAQLAVRVNKKLDKDEMLWTQEVLERQLQSVAKSALGEADLAHIKRALRGKMDKDLFQALLQQQHAKLAGLGGTGGLGGGGGQQVGEGQPLVAAKCISCSGELPPSKPQIKAAVREEVQLEVARALARQQHLHATPPATAPLASTSHAAASSSFNASSHRSVDKHKKELLLASLQQQHKSTNK